MPRFDNPSRRKAAPTAGRHNVVPDFSRHWFGNANLPMLRPKRGLKLRATIGW